MTAKSFCYCYCCSFMQHVVLNYQTVLPAGFSAQLKEKLLSSYMHFLSTFSYAHFCGYSDLTFIITVISILVHCLYCTQVTARHTAT